MKKILLIAALFTLAGFSKLDAQIVNNSFEYWYLDTFYLPDTTLSTLPADTVSFYDPVGWTSSNSLTDLDSIGSKIFVTKSPNAYSGNWAIQMITDTVKIPVAAHFPLVQVILPGFALNGIFPITSIKFTGGGVTTITPMQVPGAGQPCTQRLQSISGYYNYTPAFSNATHSNDTCVVWATLRKGTTLVANAVFKSTASTGGYLPFSANFDYVSCEVPDTLVVLMASSTLNVSGFLNGSVPAGSMLLVDSLTYDTLAADYVFAPFAENDLSTMYENQIDTVDVLANDTDCSGAPLTVTLVSGPHHGTASLMSNYDIIYTPATNYFGFDTIVYRDTNNSGDTSDAVLTVFIEDNAGINELNEVQLSLYPVPADNLLHIQFQNPGKCRGYIYDVVGNLVMTTELNNNNNGVSIQNLPGGIYGIEIMNGENAVIARNKFVITR